MKLFCYTRCIFAQGYDVVFRFIYSAVSYLRTNRFRNHRTKLVRSIIWVAIETLSHVFLANAQPPLSSVKNFSGVLFHALSVIAKNIVFLYLIYELAGLLCLRNYSLIMLRLTLTAACNSIRSANPGGNFSFYAFLAKCFETQSCAKDVFLITLNLFVPFNFASTCAWFSYCQTTS